MSVRLPWPLKPVESRSSLVISIDFECVEERSGGEQVGEQVGEQGCCEGAFGAFFLPGGAKREGEREGEGEGARQDCEEEANQLRGTAVSFSRLLGWCFEKAELGESLTFSQRAQGRIAWPGSGGRVKQKKQGLSRLSAAIVGQRILQEASLKA